MTTTADAPADLLELSHARRLAVAELVTEMLATERELATLYGGFAVRSRLDSLRTVLAELAQEKTAHVSALEPLARAFHAVAPSIRTGRGEVREEPVDARPGAEFSLAFRGERALEVGYRELGSLLGDPTLLPVLPGLAADAARHQARLRAIYLRYS